MRKVLKQALAEADLVDVWIYTHDRWEKRKQNDTSTILRPESTASRAIRRLAVPAIRFARDTASSASTAT